MNAAAGSGPAARNLLTIMVCAMACSMWDLRFKP